MQYDFDSETDSRPGGGFKGLAVAIIRQAVWDIRNGNTWQRATAGRFILDDNFDELADAIGLNPDAVRERLRSKRARQDHRRATEPHRALVDDIWI